VNIYRARSSIEADAPFVWVHRHRLMGIVAVARCAARAARAAGVAMATMISTFRLTSSEAKDASLSKKAPH
jgi:hypothetical protein